MSGKKVLLVNYAGFVTTGNTFIADNSLATLAGVLIKNDIPVEIIDLQSPVHAESVVSHIDAECSEEVFNCLSQRKQVSQKTYDHYMDQRGKGLVALEEWLLQVLIAKILKEDVGLIGFKLWAGNGLAGMIRVAETLRKEFPKLLLVAGGPAIRYSEGLFFKRSQVFDYLINGDGEEAILMLAKGSNRPIPGSFKLNGAIVCSHPPQFIRDLNSIPFPVYEKKIYPNINDFFRVRVIDDSRGCFNRCSFCSHVYFGSVTRKKDPTRVVDEIEFSVREEGVHYFRFSGSNPPWKFLVKVGEEIIRRKLDVRYSAYCSMNNVNPDDFDLLYRSGLRGLFFGIESADKEFLKSVHNKNNRTPEFSVEVAHAAMRAQIFICASVIVPSPFETESTKESTFKLLESMFGGERNLCSVLVLPAFLGFGSEWWNNMEKYGFEFTKGVDKESYLNNVLDFDVNFLFPRTYIKGIDYTLNGKNSVQLFAECQDFINRLEDAGISTNLDDASYMLGHMGRLNTREFKASIMKSLVMGRSGDIQSLVQKINQSRNFDKPINK